MHALSLAGLVLSALPLPATSVRAATAAPQQPAAAAAAADFAVMRGGCLRCHADSTGGPERRQLPLGPRLDDAVRWHAADGGIARLRAHHGGDDAADLAAWLGALAAGTATAVPSQPLPGAVARGEQLVRELACAACHDPTFGGLHARVDHGRLATFLAAPQQRVPDLVHPPLTGDEAADVAAWLLREQRRAKAATPGFRWTAWTMRIRDAGLPNLAGRQPAATGTTERIGLAMAPRANDYVLRFDGTVDVPVAGEWTFTLGSDDSSWMWLDDVPRIRNEELAPHRERSATVALTAGRHAITVLYTQASGKASLDLRWRGPGVDDAPVPSVAAGGAELVPPAAPAAPAAEAVARGRAAARARRCDACHAFQDAAFAALPTPPPAQPWAGLGAGACPQTQDAAALRGASPPGPRDLATTLAFALQRDGCLACHRRDGNGGLAAAVREQLAEVQDLGDEGRLPPDLTAVGRRLRPAWIEKVLRTGHAVRPYLRVRMPAVGAERAQQYAAWFAAVDDAPADAAAPPGLADVAHGRQLAGLGGRNCIICHTVHGLPSLGVQGMDLAIQYERMQPAWFADWLLQPAALRPGTRMPAMWWQDDAAARRDIAALWAWLSLGAAAPTPPGAKPKAGSLQLFVADRPRLHGAFLDGVSARCLCVGTPERTHFAWDLTRPGLTWLWRGDFLDAAGTWSGRAGKLLRPLGTEPVVLPDLVVRSGASRRLRGQRIDADGYPWLQVEVGDARYEDGARARLVAGGSEVVRTLRGLAGVLEVEIPAAPGVEARVAGTEAGRHTLAAGATLEVVYRW